MKSDSSERPGDEGARHSVILSLLVDDHLFLRPQQQRQLKNNLPAYTVWRMCGTVCKWSASSMSSARTSYWSDDPQEKLKRFSNALHKVLAFGSSKKHMIHRQFERSEPTPFLKYRADATHTDSACAVNLKN